MIDSSVEMMTGDGRIEHVEYQIEIIQCPFYYRIPYLHPMEGNENFTELIEKIANYPSQKVHSIASNTHHEVFQRTDCLSCGNCCKSAPPIITKQDIKRIAKHLKVSTKHIMRHFVLEDFNGELSFDSVPCPFLGEDNYCSIYESRPNACRDYPHTGSGHFLKRKRLHVQNADICPAVREILNLMEQRLAAELT